VYKCMLCEQNLQPCAKHQQANPL